MEEGEVKKSANFFMKFFYWFKEALDENAKLSGYYGTVILGLAGLFGHPLYYILWKYIDPQPYENLTLRIIGAISCLILLTIKFWRGYFRKLIPIYWFLAASYNMPFVFTAQLICNRFSVTWCMAETAMVFFIIMMVPKYVLLPFSLFFSVLFAVLYSMGNSPELVNFNLHFMIFTMIPVFSFCVIVGFSFSYSNVKGILATEKSEILKSLAGSIAHEMRNPLNSIINAVDYIRISLPNRPVTDLISGPNIEYKIDKANLIEIYNAIDQSGVIIKRGNKIIDSILANMRGEGIEMSKFTRITASQEIKNAINDYGYKNMSDKRLIDVNLNDDFEFFGDRDLFVYILFNLIKNSLYYKDKEGFKIEITTKKEASRNIIKVKDYGPGISTEKIGQIFQSFFSSDKEGGTGLGLSFCKRTMASFRGDIKCSSEFGKWTEFELSFPLYKSAEIKEIQSKILKQKKILIIDDNDICSMTIKHILSDSVKLVDIAINGERGLEKISKERYDLIFMDVEMPVLNGYETTKIIRSGNYKNIDKSIVINYDKVPIIATTSLSEGISKERAMFFGMNDFIHKPVNREVISKTIDKWFFTEKLGDNPKSLANLSKYALGKTMLLVDDEETNLKFSSRFLENFGFKVHTAKNGQEAIELLEKETCDMVLMDAKMPVIDGFEATRIIRDGTRFKNFKNFKKIPIIALTGDTDKETFKRANDCGMNTLIGKPILPAALVNIVKNYLI